MAKLFHNIAALLVQKDSGLLIASVCMRRSIELRKRINLPIEDEIGRLSLLCKIMLRLSEPCACVSVLLEMISCATLLCASSTMSIPSEIFTAFGSFACWCQRNECSMEQVSTPTKHDCILFFIAIICSILELLFLNNWQSIRVS